MATPGQPTPHSTAHFHRARGAHSTAHAAYSVGHALMCLFLPSCRSLKHAPFSPIAFIHTVKSPAATKRRRSLARFDGTASGRTLSSSLPARGRGEVARTTCQEPMLCVRSPYYVTASLIPRAPSLNPIAPSLYLVPISAHGWGRLLLPSSTGARRAPPGSLFAPPLLRAERQSKRETASSASPQACS